MSLAGMRAQFAGALDTVETLVGFEFKPTVPKAGDSWPMRGAGVRDKDSGMFLVSWSVVICLPSDEKAAEEWMDQHLEEVFDAIQPVAYVTSFDEFKLQSGEYALVLTTESE